jgi:Transposase DDE domain group 1
MSPATSDPPFNSASSQRPVRARRSSDARFPVASVSTARRVVQSVSESELVGIRAVRARARARAWELGGSPQRVILDFDATPVVVHSEKEQAAGHYKGGFGFNPLIVSCDREVLAGVKSRDVV